MNEKAVLAFLNDLSSVYNKHKMNIISDWHGNANYVVASQNKIHFSAAKVEMLATTDAESEFRVVKIVEVTP